LPSGTVKNGREAEICKQNLIGVKNVSFIEQDYEKNVSFVVLSFLKSTRL